MRAATYCKACGLDKLFLAEDGLCEECRWEAVDSGNESAGTVRAADVHPELVEWLWANLVPRAMPTVLGGFPGVGKSTILYDLAARVSREGQTVLAVTAEDHLAAVVRPRLEAAGADLNLVRIVTIPITLPDDVGRLKELVREFEAALLILDPLVAFIGDGINTHRDHHVRRVLAPLADLAEETRAAVVVVIHTNKGVGSEPLMRISGSIGFTGAARSVLLAADDPQDESRRILAVVKSNLAEMPPPLAYQLTGALLNGGISTSRVEWLGEAPEVDIRELLVSRDPEERGATEDAQDFLRELGLLETARPAGDVLRDAKAQGHAERTVKRARKRLRIPTWRDGFGRAGVWYWGPRGGVPIDATHRGQPTLGPLAPMDLPAETDPSDTIGANTPTLGDGGRDGCPECGSLWVFGHAEDCSRRMA
jgi:AAA domain